MKSRLELSVREIATDGSLGLGIQVTAMEKGLERKVPLIRECGTYEELKQGVEECKSALDQLLAEAEAVLREHTATEGGTIEEAWGALQKSQDEDTFVCRFNALGENTRIELAEYVLTTQNMFKGFASVFSKRYDEQTHALS
ncbi:MAG: hypothetical protein HY788_21065 [Deltaproteobacteria bacterium]|nr:hypothetical protein [Deltaproteobacteria bacterium]